MYMCVYARVCVYVNVHVYEKFCEIFRSFESAGWGMIRSEITNSQK